MKSFIKLLVQLLSTKKRPKYFFKRPKYFFLLESLWDEIQGWLKGITLLRRLDKNLSSSSRLYIYDGPLHSVKRSCRIMGIHSMIDIITQVHPYHTDNIISFLYENNNPLHFFAGEGHSKTNSSHLQTLMLQDLALGVCIMAVCH